MEGTGGVDDGKDQVPKFCLFEAFALHAISIDDLIAEQVGVVPEGHLHVSRGTVLTPPLPQNSVFSKRCPVGKKRFSLSDNEESCFSQRLNSASLGRATVTSMAPSSYSEATLTTRRLPKRGWFMTRA